MNAALEHMIAVQRPDTTILDVLLRHAAATPDKIAYRFLAGGDVENESLTFRQLVQEAQHLATHLCLTTPPQTCVLLLLDSGLPFIKAMFACMFAGLIPVAVDLPRPYRSTDRLKAIVRHSGARAFVTSATDLPRVDKLRAAVPALKQLDCYLVGAQTAVPALSPAVIQPSPDMTAFIQYTSGSTNTPKGVVITHRNLISNQLQIKSAFAHDERTIFAGWLPMFHDMGLIGNVLHPLFLGVESTLMPRRGIRSAAAAVAEGHFEIPGHDEWRTELRVRSLRQPDCR